MRNRQPHFQSSQAGKHWSLLYQARWKQKDFRILMKVIVLLKIQLNLEFMRSFKVFSSEELWKTPCCKTWNNFLCFSEMMYSLQENLRENYNLLKHHMQLARCLVVYYSLVLTQLLPGTPRQWSQISDLWN